MTVFLDGLNCANCAAKIHSDIQKLPYVSNSDLNLVTKKLTLKTSKSHDKTLKEIKKIVKKYEPDVIVSLHQSKEAEKPKIKNWIHLLIGGILLVLSFFTAPNSYMFTAVSILSYLITGCKVLVKTVKNILNHQFLDENLLMTVASIGAIAIGDYREAIAVMLFYSIGELLQDSAVNKSRASIKSLMDIRPDTATIIDEKGNANPVDAKNVKLGDIILIKPQERIPLDCIITDGNSTVDVSSITGESIPRTVNKGDTLISGSINISGVLYGKVTAEFSDSTATKILELMESSISKKSKSEGFITKFAKIYTPIVVALAFLMAVIPAIIFKGENFSLWLTQALTFLVISCPCALVISVPLSFFSGIGICSKRGILIKGSNYLELLANVKNVVFDKTGTLTYGKFSIKSVVPFSKFTEDELIKTASAVERLSSHPIAKAFNNFEDSENEYTVTDFKELSGLGVTGIVNGHKISAGNSSLLEKNGVKDLNIPKETGTVIHISKDTEYMGYIIVADTPKTESCAVINELKKNSINTVMLSGDNLETAKLIAEEIGIDNVKAELMPKDKVENLEKLISDTKNGATVFVGDGMNDAPSLALADIGVAMGGVGTDAAIESADVVIMSDDLSKIPEVIKLAKFTRKIMTQCIIMALTIKIIIMILSALGFANMWAAVFADVGVSLLAVLNTFRKPK